MTLRKKISLWLFALMMIFGIIPFFVMYQFQDIFTFPVPDAVGPAGPVGSFERVEITTRDQERLRAWYHPAEAGQARILVFHGNAELASNQFPLGEALVKAGFGVLLAEYRGYGGSTGKPTEEGVIRDGLASYDFLRAQSDAPIGIVAHSLGTGIAIPVAALRPPFAVVLKSPMTSLPAIARYRMGWAPRDFMMKYTFHSDKVIGKLQAPILIIHGTEDKVIPIDQGREMAALAPKGTEFVALEGAGHNDLADFGTIDRTVSFLLKTLAKK